MRLQLSTWQEVENYLKTCRDIIVPIGSTEQHGPNGLIGTDAICPETIGWSFGEKYAVMIGPTLPVGMAQHHMAFPGTLSLRPSTLVSYLLDIIHSLEQHGFSNIIFLNGHGGNISTIGAACSEVYGSDLKSVASPVNIRCHLHSWWNGARVRALSEKLYADAEGSHATPSEVSLSYFAHPSAAKNVTMSPKIAPNGPIFTAADFRNRYPDGRMGSDPSLASVDAGKNICEAAVEDLNDVYRRIVKK